MAETDRESLRFDIVMALRRYGYKPPRTHDASEMDRYYAAVASDVVEHLLRMWEFTHKPPVENHRIG